jgi:S1-C subfamily serine protease
MPDADVTDVDEKGNDPDLDAVTSGNPGALARLWGKRSARVTAVITAALLAAGIGLGVTSALRGSVPADALIPSPPAKDAVFVEDDDGAGQDQQENILQSSAAGVLRIRSASGTDLGAGFVITRSGFVLTSYSGLQGAGALTARLVMSGKIYPAKLVGADSEANLALLQLSGTGFKPVAIGTAAGVQLNDRVASAGGTWAARGIMLTTGAVTGIDVPVKLDGHQLTGLLADSSLDVPASQLGGPLFNLSGQVIGLSIGHYGTDAGYVVPVDSALQLARQIAGQ